MNALLLNRDGFQMPEDGWYQLAPVGEFPHAQAGLIQVVDPEACEAMVTRFRSEAQVANFAGLLVDFDHFSLDGEKRSEAAGWITDLETRDGGLFAKIRWSDVGEEAVKGGRYRFLSPVWGRTDCVDLGNGRVRPVRLLNAAVTNDPNLKGMLPLSNSATPPGAGIATAGGPPAVGPGAPAPAAPAEPRFKWVLGASPDDRHCPSCVAVAGQVHTMAEWDAAGVKPGAAGLFCKGNCHCSLEPTTESTTGAVTAGPMRKPAEVTNAGARERNGVAVRSNSRLHEVLANVGWMDEARAASLAVRRAKAALKSVGRVKEADLLPDLPKESREAFEKAVVAGALAELMKAGRLNDMSEEETRTHLRDALSEAYRKQAARIARETGGADMKNGMLANVGWTDEARAASLAVRRAKAAARKAGGGGTAGGSSGGKGGGKDGGDGGKDDEGKDPRETDYLGWFEEEGMVSMTPEAIDALTDELRQKIADGKEPLSEVEEGFLEELTDKGYAGENDGDPIFNWQEKRAQREQQVLESTGMDFRDARAKVGDLELKASKGESLTPEEKALVDTYNGIMNNRAPGMDECDEADVVYLVNTGWTDEARVAALAVRRAKAGLRGQNGQQAGMVMPPDDGKVYLGGSPYFDERTGQYVYPVMPELPPGQGRPVPKPGIPPKPGVPGRPQPPTKPPVKPTPPYLPGPPPGRHPVPIDPPYRILPVLPPRQAPGRRFQV